MTFKSMNQHQSAPEFLFFSLIYSSSGHRALLKNVSNELSWLYIKALNIFHSNLIVLIGIWKEDVEQGELGTVNFLNQYWIDSREIMVDLFI